MNQQPSDEELLAFALEYWANHLETGELHVDSEHARILGMNPRSPSPEYLQWIQRARELAARFRKPEGAPRNDGHQS